MLPWFIRAAALVPLLAGPSSAPPAPATDNHLRYMSGLLLGVGVLALWCAADLPRRRHVFLALGVMVVPGGLVRSSRDPCHFPMTSP